MNTNKTITALVFAALNGVVAMVVLDSLNLGSVEPGVAIITASLSGFGLGCAVMAINTT